MGKALHILNNNFSYNLSQYRLTAHTMDKELVYDVSRKELVGDISLEELEIYEDLDRNIEVLKSSLDDILPLRARYDELTVEQKIELDLFLSYAITSLQWAKLVMLGQDPKDHNLNCELDRIKAAMKRWQEIKDRDKRPKINIHAAKRFIRSGLYDPNKDADGNPQKNMTKSDDN